MKPSIHQLFVSAAIACFFTLALASFAQSDGPSKAPPPPAADQTELSVPAVPSQPASNVPPEDRSAVVVAPSAPADAAVEPPESTREAASVETAAPAAEAAPAPEAVPAGESTLRRLDTPVSATPAAPESKPVGKSKRARPHHAGNEIVNIGSNSYLAPGKNADAVVSVFGNATSEGDVSDSVVAVFGNTRANGAVGNAAVAVFGDSYVNGTVGDAVVAVFGSVELGPKAVVNGDVVAVGGKVIRDPGSVVTGQVNNVAIGGLFSNMEGLRSWFAQCAMYGRMLAFGPHLMWAWWIAIGFLALYVLLAALFSSTIDKCCETLEQRAGYSMLAAILTLLISPVVVVLLVFTGVGIAVIPFLAAALFFAGLFGKAVMLAWLGRRILSFGDMKSTVLATLVGGVIVMFSYTIPVFGMIMYKLLGWLGLGVVVYTLMLAIKREKRPADASAVPPTQVPVQHVIDPETGVVSLVPALTGDGVVPPVILTGTLPRAGFWVRTLAALLDFILIGIIVALFHLMGQSVLIALAIYAACMWKLRGSTIGGIICGLKVVRLDDRPVDWATAIVRSLACFLSLAVCGLGFIWVGFDDQKQGWHDKIAGTTVVRMPKGVSLV